MVVNLLRGLDLPGWLLLTDRVAWSIFRSAGAWSFHEPSVLQAQRLNPGDKAVVYLTSASTKKPSALAAIVEIKAKMRQASGAGPFDRMYPYQVDFALIHEPKSFVEFKPLVPLLSFIPHKHHWGVYLQGKSVMAIPPEDAKIITSAMAKATASAHVSPA